MLFLLKITPQKIKNKLNITIQKDNFVIMFGYLKHPYFYFEMIKRYYYIDSCELQNFPS